MKKLKGSVSFLLGLLMLFAFSACSDTPKSNTHDTPMGRYSEEELVLPDNLTEILYLQQQDDDSILLVGIFYILELEFPQASLQCFRSTDMGTSWQQEQPGWISVLENHENIVEISAFTFDENNVPYFTYLTQEDYDSFYGGYVKEDAEDSQAQEGDNSEQDIVFPSASSLLTYSIGKIVGTTLETLDFELDFDAETMLILPGDKAVFTSYNFSGPALYDLNTGSKLMEYPADGRLLNGQYFIRGETISICSEEELLLYLLSSSTSEERISLQEALGIAPELNENMWGSDRGKQIIAPSKQDNTIFVANRSGIFSLASDFSISEKIVDGNLCSLGMPSHGITLLVPTQNNGFLAVTEDSDYKLHLYRYVYDPSVPTTPSTKLRIYSLEENPLVRQTIALFQRKNPDVVVEYTVGMQGQELDTMKTDDAIRNLNLELLSGSGPDIIIMDGLPYESYVDKGILEELSTLLPLSEIEGMFDNILQSFQNQDGSYYSLPARFSMITLVGKKEDLQPEFSLSHLADLTENAAYPMLGISNENLVSFFYPLFQNKWFSADGSLNKDAFSEDLQSLKRISDLSYGVDVPDFRGDAVGSIIYFHDGLFPVAISNLTSYTDLFPPSTLLYQNSDIEYNFLSSSSNPVVIPKTLSAISSSSNLKEISAKFISSMLSQELQRYSFGDGLPVNKEALKENLVPPSQAHKDEEGRIRYMTYGLSLYNPFLENQGYNEDDFATFSCYWPEDGFIERFFADLNKAIQPHAPNRVVQQLLEESLESYFAGNQSLESAVDTLSNKLNLILSESKTS